VLVVRRWLGLGVSTFCCLCPDCTPAPRLPTTGAPTRPSGHRAPAAPAMAPSLQHPPQSVHCSLTPSPRPRRPCSYRSRIYRTTAAVGRRAAPALPVAADGSGPAVGGSATDEPPPRTGDPPPVPLHQAAGGRERAALCGRPARRRRQAALGATGRPGGWMRRAMPSLTPPPGSPRRGREGGKVQAGTTVTQREGAAEGGGQCPRWYVRPAHSGRAQGSTPHASHHTQTVSYVSQFPPAVPVVSFRLPARLTPGDCFPQRYVRRRNGYAVAGPQCSFCGTLCEALFSGPFTTGHAGLFLLAWRGV